MRVLGLGMGCGGNEPVEEVKAGVGTFRDDVEVDAEGSSCERLEDGDGTCAGGGGGGRLSTGGPAGG